jgi:tRNA dimethylallyltransferase
MLRVGLIDEVKELKKRYDLNADMPSMRAVGYRQAWSFLEGQIDEKDLREQGIAATRQLAKRQVTWLRSLPGLEPAQNLEGALTRA